MKSGISPQSAHDLLEALLLCRSARNEVSRLKTIIGDYEKDLPDLEVARETALGKRNEFIERMSPESPFEDDEKLIAVLEDFKNADSKLITLRLTIQGQQKLLSEAERRLDDRSAERAATIASINGEVLGSAAKILELPQEFLLESERI